MEKLVLKYDWETAYESTIVNVWMLTGKLKVWLGKSFKVQLETFFENLIGIVFESMIRKDCLKVIGNVCFKVWLELCAWK